ncbi:hypothetical protein AgCh_025974 [Apium graveolens]
MAALVFRGSICLYEMPTYLCELENQAKKRSSDLWGEVSKVSPSPLSGGIPIENIIIEDWNDSDEDAYHESNQEAMERLSVHQASKMIFASNQNEREELFALRKRLLAIDVQLGARGLSLKDLEKEQLLAESKIDRNAYVFSKGVEEVRFDSHPPPLDSTIVSPPEEILLRALSRGTWFINKSPMLLSPWSLDLDRNKISSVPLWVKFSNIPKCYWTREGLSYIASSIGEPLFADAVTAKLNMVPFAKFCVKYKIGDPLPSSINILAINSSGEKGSKKRVISSPTGLSDASPPIGNSFQCLRAVDEVEAQKLAPDLSGLSKSQRKNLKKLQGKDPPTISSLRLWADLASLNINNIPWCLIGDFNVIQDLSETYGGNDRWTNDMQEFKDFLSHIGLVDIRASGTFHTWWNKRDHKPITRKLDRILGNHSWLSTQQHVDCLFTPWGLSDHSAAILNIPDQRKSKPKPFMFFNYWLENPEFLPCVKAAWDNIISGNPFYIFSQKLNLVKRNLLRLNKAQGFTNILIKETREALCATQASILANPNDSSSILQESDLSLQLWDLLSIDEIIKHQKSRVQWIQLGDHNSTYFHKKIACNWNRNKITSLMDSNGITIYEESAIKSEVVNYFSSLFKANGDYPGISVLQTQISARISENQARSLIVKVSDMDILNTLKSMKKNKSPGPDGFNVNFFLAAWDIVGPDFLKAVHFFFETGTMPHYINSTAISLIPKCSNPSQMSDFRPISCCNTLYKCISKMVASRLSLILPSIIHKSQATFVKGRQISDNILVAQEILHGYSNQSGPPRVTFKMDLHKAFDMLNWQFIIDVLILREFPPPFIRWIHSCLTSPRFSVKINGDPVGLLLGTLDTFSKFSGLCANPSRSNFYITTAPSSLHDWITNTFGIVKGDLPAKFLGVPLIIKKLSKRDCQTLMDKILLRIHSWTNHFLAYSGRLQLIKSVLFSIQAYWSAHFILPGAVIKWLNSVLSKFLWNGNSAGSKAKVAWEKTTLPLEEGGLGIKNIAEWNKALIIKHLLNVVNPSPTSLWANWIRTTTLKNTSFWSYKQPASCSWILRKVLHLHDIVRPHISYSIGNGQNVFLLFDPWLNNRPLCIQK